MISLQTRQPAGDRIVDTTNLSKLLPKLRLKGVAKLPAVGLRLRSRLGKMKFKKPRGMGGY